jgi:hypothetical protein
MFIKNLFEDIIKNGVTNIDGSKFGESDSENEVKIS